MSGQGQGVALQASKGQGCDAATRAHARAKRALWARQEHARYMLGNMPRHARGLQTTRGLAEWGYMLGQIHVTCWSSQGI